MTEPKDRQANIAMIRDSADAIGPVGDLSRVRKLRFAPPGFDRSVWREMCELGWLGLRLPEERGGIGLGMFEYCALLEELGRRLAPEPLIEAAAVAALLEGALRDDVLAGRQIVLPAWQEGIGGLTRGIETRYADGAVTGHKVFVPMAEGADALLVEAREGFVLVRRDAPGVTLAGRDNQDGGRAVDITFAGAPGEFVAPPSESWLEEATLATAAYLLGVAEQAFSITIAYLNVRKQFGKAIGSFQSLQHRAADLKIKIALTKASVEAACAAFDEGEALPFERFAAVCRAKARASATAMLVTREAIQLHGAIGYTDEHDIGLYLRKAMCLAGRYGSAREQRARYLQARDTQQAA